MNLNNCLLIPDEPHCYHQESCPVVIEAVTAQLNSSKLQQYIQELVNEAVKKERIITVMLVEREAMRVCLEKQEALKEKPANEEIKR